MRKMLAIVGGVGAAIGALLAFSFDRERGRRRRKLAVDRMRGFFNRRARQAGRAGRAVGAEVYGVAMKATHLRERPKPQPDDATLARKVETEIFRPADAPKATVSVNAEKGVVYLRGEVQRPELIEELVEKTRKVQGVRRVENLLHLPGAPAQMHQ
jgi:osmotically-inducible protein OsmY